MIDPELVQFLSTPSARRATKELRLPARTAQFLSTPSARRATAVRGRSTAWCSNFYPRPPRGGRLVVAIRSDNGILNFYPRPPRGGRLLHYLHRIRQRHISIHALREEGDAVTFEAKHTNSDFYPRPPRGGRPLAVKNSCVHEAISIHALREEGDKDNSASFLPGEGFLSTPSARRATTLEAAKAGKPR